MRRMLDPKEAGGSLPSTITFDGDGNRKVGKNLGVGGKLTLKSLVSASNPDGDITKELGGGGGSGGGTLYNHFIRIHYVGSGSDNGNLFFNYISKIETQLTLEKLKTALQGAEILCNGYVYTGNIKIVCSISGENNSLKLHLFAIDGVGGQYILNLTSDSELVSDKVSSIN